MLIDFYYWTEFLLCVCERGVRWEGRGRQTRIKCRQSGSPRQNDRTVAAYGRGDCFFTHPISPSVDVGDLRLGSEPGNPTGRRITGTSSPVNHTAQICGVPNHLSPARLWNVAHTSEWAQHTAAFTGPQRQQPLADDWVGCETLISADELLTGGTY